MIIAIDKRAVDTEALEALLAGCCADGGPVFWCDTEEDCTAAAKALNPGLYVLSDRAAPIKRPTAAQALTAASAALTAARVSDKRRAVRLEVCNTREDGGPGPCSKLGADGRGSFCSLCGCRIKARRAWLDLLGVEENLPAWGCKHPTGSRWKAAGV